MAKTLPYDDELLQQTLSRLQDQDGSDSLEKSLLSIDPTPPFLLTWSEAYKNPRYVRLIGDDRVCGRCGTVVHAAARRAHSRYHRSLDLAIQTIGAMLQGMAEDLERLDQRKPKI